MASTNSRSHKAKKEARARLLKIIPETNGERHPREGQGTDKAVYSTALDYIQDLNLNIAAKEKELEETARAAEKLKANKKDLFMMLLETQVTVKKLRKRIKEQEGRVKELTMTVQRGKMDAAKRPQERANKAKKLERKANIRMSKLLQKWSSTREI